MDHILFDREEANLSSQNAKKRYEDAFNCRVLVFKSSKEEKKYQKSKWLNMDYAILHANLKRHLINKKVKFEKQMLKLSRQQSGYNNSILSSPQQTVSSAGQRKKSFLKQPSSPLSVLDYPLKEESIDGLFESGNKLSAFDFSAVATDSSESFVLDDEDEGEDIQYFTTARSHRLSMNHSEEMLNNQNLAEELPTSHHFSSSMSEQFTGTSYYKNRSYEEISTIQFDFQNFQPAESYNEYKENIIANTINANKPSKYLVDNSDSFDKRCLLQSSFERLKVDYAKYPELETQAINLHMLEIDQNEFLSSSSLSTLQKIQITQADLFVFELRDCSMVMENIDSGFSQVGELENILKQVEQLISTIYENMDPSSQNIETPFMFTCCTCNSHVDNQHTIENGAIKKLNPKILEFFQDVGINYQTNFFPIILETNASESSSKQYSNDESYESLRDLKYPTLSSSAASRNNEKINILGSMVNHDTGRLMVSTLEETIFQITRKIISNKLDMYYQVEKKNGRLSSTSNLESTAFSNTQSSFFVSKDVRAATNRSPPIYSPAFTNNIVVNTASTVRQDSEQFITPVTENFTLNTHSTTSNYNFFNPQHHSGSTNSSPLVQRSVIRSEGSGVTKTSSATFDSLPQVSQNFSSEKPILQKDASGNVVEALSKGSDVSLATENIKESAKVIINNTAETKNNVVLNEDVVDKSAANVVVDASFSNHGSENKIQNLQPRLSAEPSSKKLSNTDLKKQLKPTPASQPPSSGSCCVVM